MTIAFLSYRRYYPRLTSAHCDIPYPSRADTQSGSGFGKLKDEEERIDGVGNFAVDDMEDEAETVPLRETSRDRARGPDRVSR